MEYVKINDKEFSGIDTVETTYNVDTIKDRIKTLQRYIDGLQQSIKTSNDEIDSYNQLLAQAAAIDIDINS